MGLNKSIMVTVTIFKKIEIYTKETDCQWIDNVSSKRYQRELFYYNCNIVYTISNVIINTVYVWQIKNKSVH